MPLANTADRGSGRHDPGTDTGIGAALDLLESVYEEVGTDTVIPVTAYGVPEP